jgi:hypothetical protein
MAGRQKIKAGIVAMDKPQGSCPVVTFQFPEQSIGGAMLVTLTLCEWQRLAQQIAEAAIVMHN